MLIGTVLSALGTDYAHRRGLLVPGTDPAQRAAARTIWYAVLALVVLSVVVAPFAPWVALAIVIVTRVSALLPLGSDRAGYAGDPGAGRQQAAQARRSAAHLCGPWHRRHLGGDRAGRLRVAGPVEDLVDRAAHRLGRDVAGLEHDAGARAPRGWPRS